MSLFVSILVYLHLYGYLERKFKKKEILEEEKGVKGVKGVKYTLREIDEKISKNKSTV